MGTIWPGHSVRLAVISDTHSNLYALQAALASIAKDGVDGIIHTGDVIGFGPHPGECLDLLMASPGISLLKGNHEIWFLRGNAGPGKTAGFISHIGWIWARLNAEHKDAVGNWPIKLVKEIAGFRACFQHYALDDTGQDFQDIESPPSGELYDRKFGDTGCQAVFFGHDHAASDTRGRARYINPGSLGTGPEPAARYVLASFIKGGMEIEKKAVTYDREPLWRDFEKLSVPGTGEIISRFYGTRKD